MLRSGWFNLNLREEMERKYFPGCKTVNTKMFFDINGFSNNEM